MNGTEKDFYATEEMLETIRDAHVADSLEIIREHNYFISIHVMR